MTVTEDTVKLSIESTWSHVYARSLWDDSHGITERANNVDKTLEMLEKTVKNLWEFAEENNYESILENSDDIPTVTEARRRYKREIFSDDEFDSDAFQNIIENLHGAYEQMVDLNEGF